MAFSLRARSRALFAASIAVSYAFTAVGGTIQFTRSGLNARGTMDFRRAAGNVLGTVPAGTEGDVVGRFKLPSGNYAIQVQIKKIDTAKSRLKPDQKIWVYYHNDADLRRVALFDDAGKAHDNAVDGTWAVALDSFKVAVEKPKTETEKDNGNGGQVCTTCNVDGSQKNSAPLTNSEVTVTSDVVDEVKEDASDAPVLDVGVEEIATFMAQDQKKQLGKSAFKKTNMDENRVIAQALIDACKDENVPVELMIALMQQESHFYRFAKSKAKDKYGRGARGLMQLMPANIIEYYKLSDKEYFAKSSKEREAILARAYDPKTNVKMGVHEFAGYWKKFDGDAKAALASYNMGLYGYQQYLAGKRKMSKETRNYIPIVIGNRDTYVAYEQTSHTNLASVAMR